MTELVTRIERLRPGIQHQMDFMVMDDGSGPRLMAWDKKFDPIPTDEELLAVDLTIPTAEQRDRLTLKALRAKIDAGGLDASDVKQVVVLLLKREFREGGA